MRAPAVVGSLLLALGLAGTARAADLIPARIANAPGQPIPFWLSAEAAVKPNGRVRWNAIQSPATRHLADAKRAEFAVRRAKSGGEFFGPVGPADCREFLGTAGERNPGTSPPPRTGPKPCGTESFADFLDEVD